MASCIIGSYRARQPKDPVRRMRWISAASTLLAVGAATSLVTAQQTAGKPETPPADAPPVPADQSTGGEFAAPAPNAATDAPDPDKPTYRVGAFVIRYTTPHPQYPALDDLNSTTVTLGRTDLGLVAPGGGVPTVTYTLEDLASQPAQRFTFGALTVVGAAVRDAIIAEGLVGIRVNLSEREFAPVPERVEGEPPLTDLRPEGQTSVTLMVSAVRVREVRSVAFGDKVPFEQRINNPRYDRIVQNSPIQPFDPDDENRSDLLRKDKLDDYVFRLNRHPGRRVDLGIAAAEQEDELILDYYINENKPWLIYAQVSNTGTEETSEWRERFGFTNNQLTNSDDILNIDYVTAGFDKSHAVNISYERPVWGDWLRARVFGAYSEFTASDVGATGEEFNGDSWNLGAELVANVYQHRDWFLDGYLGARWENIGIENSASQTLGTIRNDFFLTSLGLRLEHQTDVESLSVEAGFEIPWLDVSDTDKDEVRNSMQRLNASTDWLIFQWNAGYSFYLEPLVTPTKWRNWDPINQATWPVPTHEMAFAFRGQYAFDERLIPNFQQVAGGLYTVRGYPESVVSGDSIVIGSAEYRFHLPQALGFDPNPGKLWGQTFRSKPQGPYGTADWDLILKGFLDAARTGISSGGSDEEKEHTLLGTGVGAEFLFRRNFSLRVDWGVALQEVDEDVNGVKSGSNRFHISATILF